MDVYEKTIPSVLPISVILTSNQTQELVRVLVLTKRAGLPGALSFAVVGSEDPAERQVWLSLPAARYLWDYEKTPSKIKDAVRAELDILAGERRSIRLSQSSAAG